jgi:hypothetical protein
VLKRQADRIQGYAEPNISVQQDCMKKISVGKGDVHSKRKN